MDQMPEECTCDWKFQLEQLTCNQENSKEDILSEEEFCMMGVSNSKKIEKIKNSIEEIKGNLKKYSFGSDDKVLAIPNLPESYCKHQELLMDKLSLEDSILLETKEKKKEELKKKLVKLDDKIKEIAPKILTAECDKLKNEINHAVDPKVKDRLQKDLKVEEDKIQNFIEDYMEDLLHQNLITTFKNMKTEAFLIKGFQSDSILSLLQGKAKSARQNEVELVRFHYNFFLNLITLEL